jgi:hypothetical protein
VDQWSINLTPSQVARLRHDLKVLGEAGISRLTLAGYADIRSTLTHNNFLSDHRAAAVENFLNSTARKLGLPLFSFTLKTGGPTTRFGSGYQTNRRTTVTSTPR